MSIRNFVLRRLVLLIPTLIGLSMLTFAIARLVPGDPVGLAAGPQATEEIKETLRREFGLDQPLPLQYVNYMLGIFRGDWGESLYTRRPVIGDISTFFPATLELTTLAVLIAAVLGIPAGVVSSLYQNRMPDHVTRVISLFFVSFPAFWLAMILQTWIGRDLALLPIGKRFPVLDVPPETITGLFTTDSLLRFDFQSFTTALRHLMLPAFVLSLGAFASITRITRASMIETINQDFVRTAYAKGLANRAVIIRHILRNAIIPTLTVISLNFGWLMAGAILIEIIFDWPGMGLYVYESSLSLDFQPIMGITLVYGVVFSLVNILTDVIYAVLDPRIRYGEG